MKDWVSSIHPSRPDRDEQGEVLIAVLVFLLLFALILGTILSGVQTNFTGTLVTHDQSQLRYAADGGLQWGVSQLTGGSSACGAGSAGTLTGYTQLGSPTLGITNNGNTNVNVKVQCRAVSGLGSNGFGGYAVITGLNYPAAASGSQEFAGNTTKCQSISADPIGSGKSTYASAVNNNGPPQCLTYPSGSAPAVWEDSAFDPTDASNNALTLNPAQMNGMFALDATDVFAVGSPVSAPAADNKREGIFWYDGEDSFNFISPSTTINQSLAGVWASDTSDVWTVGNNGTILYCSANCTTTSPAPTWATQTSNTTANLADVVGRGSGNSANLWAVGGTSGPGSAGTILYLAGGSWSTWGVTNGTVGTTNASSTVTSSSLFTGSANYVNDAITYTGANPNPIPNNTTITAENNTGGTVGTLPAHSAQISHNATATNAAAAVTLTVPLPVFTSVFADGSGNIWATASNAIWECSANCSSASANWAAVSGVPAINYTAVAGTGSTLYAVGGNTVAVCTATCNAGASWTKVTLTGGISLDDVVAPDSTDVWAVGSSGSNGVAVYCTSTCTSAASWATQALSNNESTLYNVAAIPSASRSDQTTWSGDLWSAGAIPGGAANGTGWITYSPLTSGGPTLLDVKGGNLLNAQGTNVVTTMQVQNGGTFTQYYTSGSCPSAPANLQLSNANNYSCITSVPSSVASLDEPLPSEAAGSFAACVKAGSCTANPASETVTVNSGGCSTYTEYAPGYYTKAPTFTAGNTYYFESGVYYFKTGNWGALDTQPKTGSADATVTADSTTVTDASLFTGGANYVGWAITDSADSLAGNTTVVSENNAAHTAVLSLASTSSSAGDAFTVDNPYFVIGGHPAANGVGPNGTTLSETPTVVSGSPCWSYISTHDDTYEPAGNWWEGGGTSPDSNGTGVEWIMGSNTWLDIHSIDLELFTRVAPTTAASTNEGAQGLSIREIPPTCSGSPTLGSDGAAHPGPYCVGSSSGWSATSPGGAPAQVVQIDANNHDPYVYIHGAIYMPDNNVTLFTNQPQRDVWLGSIDVNSIELTFDSSQSPPIQLIAGGPSSSQVEIVAEAQDGSSGPTYWEEAVATIASNGTATSIQSWRTCDGSNPSNPCAS